jgi:galactose mutarotase-like enzyme
MPVSIGFHPYLQLTDSLRENWTIRIAAQKQWVLNSDKIPTGESTPIAQRFPDPPIGSRLSTTTSTMCSATSSATGRAEP